MPKPYSHVSNKRIARTFSGEKEARHVVEWLNFQLFEDDAARRARSLIEKVTGERVRHREEQGRVIEILRLYEQYCIDWKNLQPQRTHPDIHIFQTKRKKTSASQKLKSRLRRYTFYPRFLPVGKVLSFAWVPTREDAPDRYGEISAIADLAKLAEKDLLGHLKECHCGRWIWARFSHQRFCSAKCREREFRSSEKWKEHRRQKAREYYRLHKHKNVK